MAASSLPIRIRHRLLWGTLQFAIGGLCFIWTIWSKEGSTLLGFLSLTQGFFGWTLLVNPAIYITPTELQIRTAFGGVSKRYLLSQGVVVDGKALYIGEERVVYYAWLIHEGDWQEALLYLQRLEQGGSEDLSKHLITD